MPKLIKTSVSKTVIKSLLRAITGTLLIGFTVWLPYLLQFVLYRNTYSLSVNWDKANAYVILVLFLVNRLNNSDMTVD